METSVRLKRLREYSMSKSRKKTKPSFAKLSLLEEEAKKPKVKTHAQGRKPKYDSAQAIVDSAFEYFERCDKFKQQPEKAGLCLALGISRETYSQYRNSYPDAIKGIDLYIESAWARRLNGQSPAGAIFYLKNAFSKDFKDKIDGEVNHRGSIIYLPGKEKK